MVPYEAFVCRCGAGDVVLRESYKLETRSKLYYACPRSKIILDVDFFMERGTSPSTQLTWSFNDSKLFIRTFNTSKLFFKTFYTSKLFSRIFKKYRVLKLQALALAWKDKGCHRCEELREAVGSNDWVEMLVLYCWRSVEEDFRVAGRVSILEISLLSDGEVGNKGIARLISHIKRLHHLTDEREYVLREAISADHERYMAVEEL
nr:reverse transcriptase domain-containing protein [Tanacetum cinerariifolium]